MKRLIYSTVILSLLLSCSPEYKAKLIGTWTIDHVIVRGKDNNYMYLSNLATFQKNGTCSIPPTNRNENRKGEWSVEKQDTTLVLILDIENNGLRGKYKLNFWKDSENKLLKATLLKGDSLRIICSKMLHNYE